MSNEAMNSEEGSFPAPAEEHLPESSVAPKFWAIIPATGIGQRFQSTLPKQYHVLKGKTILEHSAAPFLRCPWIEAMVIALNPQDNYFKLLPLRSHPKVNITEGGAERWISVFNSLEKLKTLGAEPNDWVLVHDAVRPCITEDDLNSLNVKLSDNEIGGFLGLPVFDTLRLKGPDGKLSTVDRTDYIRAATPQMYRLKHLDSAFTMAKQFNINLGDETTGIELLGLNPTFVEGRPTNIKVTYPDDLKMAEFLLQSRFSSQSLTEIESLTSGAPEVPEAPSHFLEQELS